MKFDLRPKDVPASYQQWASAGYGKGDKFFNSHMSAIGGKADIVATGRNVCF
jgi:hypothetical protein